MPCLISVTRSGKYCCLEAPKTGGQLRHLDLNSGALIFKAANLPPTPLLMQVGKEWVESGITVGAEACSVVCKPGCYRLDIDCADYDGVDAPATGATELCYEYDKNFDKTAWALEQASVFSDAANTTMLDCLEELKLLTAANNDGLALSEILTALQAVCDKLLAQADQNTEMLEALAALCEKIEIGNSEQLECFEEMKLLLTCEPKTPLGVSTAAWS